MKRVLQVPMLFHFLTVQWLNFCVSMEQCAAGGSFTVSYQVRTVGLFTVERHLVS